ncbi:unnamed protein product [Larinioides sclopetarius]|uniref:Uncharacterized protein n=1 Tax=Larinioides sclopetarius TaxID=280406 RepID=A0AAV1YUE5_9ARAC
MKRKNALSKVNLQEPRSGFLKRACDVTPSQK